MHDSSTPRSDITKKSNLEARTYGLSELAALLGVSYTTVHQMAQAGTLPVTPLRIGRRYLFPKRSVHRLLNIDSDAVLPVREER